jgi:hypothetical protein
MGGGVVLDTLKALKRFVVFATRVVGGSVILAIGAYLLYEKPWHHFFLWGFLISINLIAVTAFSFWDRYREKYQFSIREWFHGKCVEGFPPPKPVVVPAPPRRRGRGSRIALKPWELELTTDEQGPPLSWDEWDERP